MSSWEIALCVILVFTSAFMSSSEIALFSLSRFQLRSLKDRPRSGYRTIKKLLSDPGGLLISVLVVNEIVNISLSAILTEAVASQRSALSPDFMTFGGRVPTWAIDTLLGIVVTAPIVLLISEATPKVIAARANLMIAQLTARPLMWVYRLTAPARIALRFLVSRITRMTSPGEPDEGQALLKESDFILLAEEGHKEGAIQENELELIKNVFELDDTTASEIATPLSRAQVLPETATLKDALTLLPRLKYSRLPILDSDRNVVGILYKKDLLRARMNPGATELQDQHVSEIMRKPLYVLPTLRLNALFRKFKQQRNHMAILQNSNGDSLGLVTMNDVLEELFDDVLPEESGSAKP